jgi:hypothetical protein
MDTAETRQGFRRSFERLLGQAREARKEREANRRRNEANGYAPEIEQNEQKGGD